MPINSSIFDLIFAFIAFELDVLLANIIRIILAMSLSKIALQVCRLLFATKLPRTNNALYVVCGFRDNSFSLRHGSA